MEDGTSGVGFATLLQLELDALIACRQALTSTDLPSARTLIERLLQAHQTRLERIASLARTSGTSVPDIFSQGRGFATPGFIAAALRGTGSALRALRIDEAIAAGLYEHARTWKSVPRGVRALLTDSREEQRGLLAALDSEIASRVWEHPDTHP